MKTHQEIVDALCAMSQRQMDEAAAKRELDWAERELIQQACGEIGHIYNGGSRYLMNGGPCCVACGVAKWRAEEGFTAKSPVREDGPPARRRAPDTSAAPADSSDPQRSSEVSQ